jgi:hypothetical protein
MPLVPGLLVDLGPTPNVAGANSNNGVASITTGATNVFVAVVNLDIPSGAIYFTIMEPAVATHYTLADIIAGFGMHGELCYSIVDWEG